MPTENRKRGRREEKKRKREQQDADKDAKRHKREEQVDTVLQQYDDAQPSPDQTAAPYQDGAMDVDVHVDADVDGVTRPGAMPFYGMLDEDEQEYFKKADEMLELNQFADPEERAMFLANIWKEADGKELKIANSQSCSRLMERLILLSTADQLKRLFQKFSSQ
jgi:nucleolar protein 9